MNGTERNKSDNSFLSLIVVGIIIVWLSISIIQMISGKTWIDIINDDPYGKLDTLFSGLAFAGVIAAIYLQKQELQLQREELKETREELKSQTEQFQAQNEILRNSSLHQVLMPMLLDYRSPEMLQALRALWELYEQYPSDFVEVYEQRRAIDATIINSKAANQKIDMERDSLHYKRRLVSQFYEILGGLYELNVIPAQVLYTHWGEQALKIIPKILIPIEERLHKTINPSGGKSLAIERLTKLYESNPYREFSNT